MAPDMKPPPRMTRQQYGRGYCWELDPLDPANQPEAEMASC